ncbi:uncharacterized protein ACBT57_024902 [Dama dama]
MEPDRCDWTTPVISEAPTHSREDHPVWTRVDAGTDGAPESRLCPRQLWDPGPVTHPQSLCLRVGCKWRQGQCHLPGLLPLPPSEIRCTRRAPPQEEGRRISLGSAWWSLREILPDFSACHFCSKSQSSSLTGPDAGRSAASGCPGSRHAGIFQLQVNH